MSFRLVDKGWGQEIRQAIEADNSSLCIVCPFIKRDIVKNLLELVRPETVRVITRFDCCAFFQGVNDLSALRLLLECGARVRGIKHIHAKTYLPGENTAIVTSANLSRSAFDRNAEFGFIATSPDVRKECEDYFKRLWDAAGTDLTTERLRQFEEIVANHQQLNGRAQLRTDLPDFGLDLGISPNDAPAEVVAAVTMPPQAFVKFWGNSGRAGRLDRSTRVFDDVVHAGSHLACAYPKRPNGVNDGAVMFMGRMVRDPNDIIVQGRAIGRRHDRRLDVASQAEIGRRPFMRKYRFLIRVENPEFIAGTLNDGISLNALMERLGPQCFRSTKEHAAAGSGNTDPRMAYRRHPSVELSEDGFAWLNSNLEEAFNNHGKIAQLDLDASDQLPLPNIFAGR